MFNYEFVLTEKCDWNCEYCVFPTIPNPQEFDFDKIKHHMDYILPIVNSLAAFIGVEGGELGSISEEKLYRFFSLFDKVTVDTNGHFLRNGYHKGKLRPFIKEIFWHVSEDCYPMKHSEWFDYDIPIIAGIVGDYNKMKEFIELNSHINFEYISYDQSIESISTTDKRIIKTCRNFHNTITIDLVNERIPLCIRNYDICHIPLNEENFKNVHTKYPSEIFGNIDRCSTCSRLCIDRSRDTNLSCRLKAREDVL